MANTLGFVDVEQMKASSTEGRRTLSVVDSKDANENKRVTRSSTVKGSFVFIGDKSKANKPVRIRSVDDLCINDSESVHVSNSELSIKSEVLLKNRVTGTVNQSALPSQYGPSNMSSRGRDLAMKQAQAKLQHEIEAILDVNDEDDACSQSYPSAAQNSKYSDDYYGDGIEPDSELEGTNTSKEVKYRLEV